MTNGKDNTLAIWGEREDIRALGQRVRALIPGGQNLTDAQAAAIAQYSAVADANFLRGEIYGYQGRGGKLELVEGYKLLVRWARRISDYSDRYDKLNPGEEGMVDGDIGYRIWLLREDKKESIRFFVELGANWKEAYEQVATMAVGIVRKREAANQPPNGWSWDQVARKRALKNALNQAYGLPSPKELAAATWEVNGAETQPEDWHEAQAYETQTERERSAEMHARHREWQERPQEERKAEADEAIEIMRDPDDYDPVAEAEAREAEEFTPPLHWSESEDNRVTVENKLAQAGIPLQTMFAACEVSSWEDMGRYEGTGNDALIAAKELHQITAPKEGEGADYEPPF